MKKKLKLKMRVKITMFLLIVCIIGGIVLYNNNQEKLYMETYEYKFLELGYTIDEIKILEEKFNNNKLDDFLKEKYNENIFKLMDEKYYIHDNFDLYYDYIKEEKVDNKTSILKINTLTYHRYYEHEINANVSLNEQVLVNKYYKLPNDYEPENLVSISTKHSWGEYGSQKATQSTYDAFISMASDATLEGITLMINSSYRSFSDQERVYNNYKDSRGERYADEIAARAGHSEHQTGYALDIFSTETSNQDLFAESQAFTFLKNNAHKYGFILRYPEDKVSITGYEYESWHYRYVGNDIASYIYENNITFDEYYAFYIEN